MIRKNLRKIKIESVDSNFELEPQIRPLGLKELI